MRLTYADAFIGQTLPRVGVQTNHMLSRRAWTSFPESDNIAIDGITLDTGQYRANLASCEARPLLKADMNAINDD